MAKKMTKAQAKKKVSSAQKKVASALGRLYKVTEECSSAGYNLAVRGSSRSGAALGSWNYNVKPYKGAKCKENASKREMKKAYTKKGKLYKGTALLSKKKRVARAKKAARARWGKKK